MTKDRQGPASHRVVDARVDRRCLPARRRLSGCARSAARTAAEAGRAAAGVQLAPIWILIAYLVSGLRDRTSEIAFIAVTILTTAAILVLYAV
jgi:hypothetical protein